MVDRAIAHIAYLDTAPDRLVDNPDARSATEAPSAFAIGDRPAFTDQDRMVDLIDLDGRGFGVPHTVERKDGGSALNQA